MAQRNITPQIGEKDFYIADFDGWYRIAIECGTDANGRPVLRIVRAKQVGESGRDQEAVWIPAPPQPAPLDAGTFVEYNSNGSWQAKVLPATGTLQVDVYLRKGDRFSSSVTIGTIHYMGEFLPVEHWHIA